MAPLEIVEELEFACAVRASFTDEDDQFDATVVVRALDDRTGRDRHALAPGGEHERNQHGRDGGQQPEENETSPHTSKLRC